MEVICVEFYPLAFDRERETLNGTLRIRVVFADVSINLLGIFVTRKKNCWRFNLPGQRSTHHETGEQIRYPYFAMEDRELNRQLMDQIIAKGRDFIEAKLADAGNPIKLPPLMKKEAVDSKPSEYRENAAETKKTTPISKPEVKASIASKVWVDPPKRIQTTAKRYK